jgi:hypothetical protein
MIPEAQQTAQYYAADCRAGRCVVVDVRTTAATSCLDNNDCYLRDGLGCCEGCDGQGFVALSHNADVALLTCGSGPIPPCLPCDSPIPSNYVPQCVANHCAVVINP